MIRTGDALSKALTNEEALTSSSLFRYAMDVCQCYCDCRRSDPQEGFCLVCWNKCQTI